jgi:environmental stress-induced protein Ves
MQTNDIIILKDNQFLAFKEDKLVKANLIIKLKEKLNLTTLLLFNRYILSLNKDSIALHQKGQGKKINIINVNSLK